jgi:hypothetical protein
MNKHLLTTALTLALWGGLSSCTTILEPQKLDNQELTAGQEVFEIKYAPLTFEVARTALRVAFFRELKISGIGTKAGLVSEEAAVGLSPPPATANPRTYRLGSGDEVTFSQLNEAPTLFLDLAGQAAASRTQPNAVSSQTGRIGSDGSALFIGVGRIELAGKTLSEVGHQIFNSKFPAITRNLCCYQRIKIQRSKLRYGSLFPKRLCHYENYLCYRAYRAVILNFNWCASFEGRESTA